MKKLILVAMIILLVGTVFAFSMSQGLSGKIVMPSNRVNIYSPENGAIYQERRIPFNITTLYPSEKLSYIYEDGNRETEKILCRKDCTEYGFERIRNKYFRDGFYNITFKSKDEKGFFEKNVWFFVDSKEPIIRKTEPRRGFANGNFFLDFDEANPVNISIFFQGKNETITSKTLNLSNCDLNRYYECNFFVNLTEFNGKEINYWFRVEDISGKVGISKINKVSVDITPPKINNVSLSIDKRRVEFIINISEENFKEVKIKDGNEIRTQETTLCRKLENGICEVKRSFRYGNHELKITAFDEAGNSKSVVYNFTIP